MPPRGRIQHKGAVPKQIEVSDIRTLKRSDLAVLAQPRPLGSLQELRDTHHRAARAIAAGLSNIEVAATCGRAVAGITRLRADPAFMNLVAHYRGLITAEYVREADPVIGYLKDNALKAAAMLSDKLDAAAEKDEFLPTRDLLGIAELGFDRTGYGKVNKNVNVNVDLASHLERARKAQDRAKEFRQIEARAVPPLAPQSPPEGDARSLSADRVAPPSSFRRL